MQAIGCLPKGSSTRHQFNGVLHNCRTTELVVEQLPSQFQLQVIQGDGGELPILKYLASYSDNCNGRKSISYSSNVLFKKVEKQLSST